MNEATTIPMTRAERLILEKIVALEKKIEDINDRRNAEGIEEISLNKAAKLLHRHPSFVIQLVDKRKLRALKYRDKGEVRYRFRLSDVRAYQEQRSVANEQEFEPIPTSAEVLHNVDNKMRDDNA
ncbi:MAG: helix-turn-helix domain-containing protein [Ignavibacteriales bacterium]|nr:helix-turn-helix domain-containing protein [Ignavibacteriales bacterium]